MKSRTKALALVLAGALALTPTASALAQDNTAVVINTKDGTSVFKFAFSISRTMGEVVDQTNAAVAYAECEECVTVALAIQVVLVMSDPSVVTPTNIAIALNNECNLCSTLASAYQIVLSTGGPVRFTSEGIRKINELRKRLRALLRAGLPIDQLQAEIDVLVDELREVIRNELVPVGSPRDDADDESSEDAETDDDSTPSGDEVTPSPTTSESPTEESPSGEPSTTPSSPPSTPEATPTQSP